MLLTLPLSEVYDRYTTQVFSCFIDDFLYLSFTKILFIRLFKSEFYRFQRIILIMSLNSFYTSPSDHYFRILSFRKYPLLHSDR